MTNSGDENNAIFDFVIPRGETGPGGGSLDVLATVDSSAQQPPASTPLIFNENPLVTGVSITHNAGSPDVVITQPGVYQATFQATATPTTGTTIPAEVTVRLYQDGVPVPGGTATHTFTSSTETATLSFSIPFQATSTPSNITAVVENDGITFENTAMTVVRLGDA